MALPGNATAVAIAGNHAYVSAFSGGIQVVDVSIPTSPQIVGSVDTLEFARGVTIAGEYAYLVDVWTGLHVVDISTPTSPQIVGGVDTPGAARYVVVSGNYAYVADAFTLEVIDISNPVAPEIVGSVATENNALSVAVSGSHAYVADVFAGLQVVDISTPESPEIVGNVLMPERALGVAISGNHAYVAARYDGLQVVDVSTPASPQIVGSVDTPGGAIGATVSGDYAYIADGEHGVHVIDISTPTSPQLLGSVDTPGLARFVALSGEYAFVADHDAGLQILPAQCESSVPIFLNSFEIRVVSGAVLIEWAISSARSPDVFRLLARRGSGQQELPILAEESDRFSAIDDSGDLGLGGEVTYFLYSFEAGLEWTLLEQRTITLTRRLQTARLLPPVPNPFNPNTKIRFDLPHGSRVSLTIYNLAGRQVRVLESGRAFSIGRHEILWDGRDDSRRTLSSGVYTCRLETENLVATQRLTLLK